MIDLDRIYPGDCIQTMRTWPDAFVNTVVTSPPYWGLRDYGVEGQIGLEASPADFLNKIVEVFREVKRVLRDDGTLWLNLGDSYCSNMTGSRPQGGFHNRGVSVEPVCRSNAYRGPGLKSKDLVGIPWRVAFALQADGWYLRQDIIWAKPNPMPESVSDRCTKSHEYIFLLAKSERYYFDQESIVEPASLNTHARMAQNIEKQIGSDRANGGAKTNGRMKAVARGKALESEFGVKNNKSFAESVCLRTINRNKRSVWTVTTQPFKEAHFATFPPKLIEPCILAGAPTGGGIVLDPFMGAGTTALVAARLNRRFVGCELNPKYIEIAERRIAAEVAQRKMF